MAKILKDDLKYLVFNELYQRAHSPRAARKAFGILEGAIQCLSKRSLNELTLDMVAREVGISRPLIKHYYKDLEDLKISCIKYVRLLFQKLAVDFLSKSNREDEMIVGYIQACFFWTKNYKAHACVWVGFLHQCCLSKKFRQLNSLAVTTGEERIRALIETGKLKKLFNFEDGFETAKAVQTVITGAVMTSLCEDLEDEERYKQMVISHCLTALEATRMRRHSNLVDGP